MIENSDDKKLLKLFNKKFVYMVNNTINNTYMNLCELYIKPNVIPIKDTKIKITNKFIE